MFGVTIVIGVDGSGRTHRLSVLAAASGREAVWIGASEVESTLEAARSDGALVVVDDAHLLGDEALQSLTAAARAGVPIMTSRRPTLDREELAELDATMLAAGIRVEALQPLTATELALLVRNVSGITLDEKQIEWILTESCGLPAIAAALGRDQPSQPDVVPPALVARSQQRLLRAGAEATAVGRVFALGLDLPDEVLSAAAEVDPEVLPVAIRSLRDSGLLTPDGHRMVPAIALAVRHEMSAAELRRVRGGVANALLASGADPMSAATQLRAARVRSPSAAEAFRAAGELVRFTDPDAALAWFDDAAEAGADDMTLAAGRAEAAALLGQPVDPESAVRPSDRNRFILAAGAVEAHHGRAARAVEALVPAGPVGQVLAVPLLVALGQVDDARRHAEQSVVPVSLQRLAEAAIAATDPPGAVPLFIEAAEVIERSAPEIVLPDTPHALGAVVAVVAGDVSTATRLLGAALDAKVGGPVAEDRHRLLLGWAHMRAGRYDTAQAELRRTAGRELPGRERLVRAALAAGIARRSGDVATMRAAWEHAEPALVRHTVDLFVLECVEELVVAAARTGKPQRAEPVLRALDTVVQKLGSPTDRPPSAWAGALGWLYLQRAVACDDPDAVRAAADRLAAVAGTSSRTSARIQAARCWADVMAGTVERAAVLAAADGLDGAELPWEASRLAGQAAIRTEDPDDVRVLLERARTFAQRSGDPAAPAAPGELTDRETEVGRLVLAGRTHKEIGAQLFLSPKTVEHHVARIRSKLGVTTRAELMAALREIFDD
jgi:DNA-binding CsgD family transcriptional regulator